MIVYTCITNGYDQLRSIKVPPGWKAICFTDGSQNLGHIYAGWLIYNKGFGLNCREVKLNPHYFLPEHERSIWIDGNLEYQGDWEALNRPGFTLMKHPIRNCIYEEADACKELAKDNAMTIDYQIERYKRKFYPRNYGLCATGVIIRDNTQENRIFGLNWWQEVKNHSHRDQLSFNFIAWKMHLKYETFPFLEGFKKYKHLK